MLQTTTKMQNHSGLNKNKIINYEVRDKQQCTMLRKRKLIKDVLSQSLRPHNLVLVTTLKTKISNLYGQTSRM